MSETGQEYGWQEDLSSQRHRVGEGFCLAAVMRLGQGQIWFPRLPIGYARSDPIAAFPILEQEATEITETGVSLG